MKIFDRNATALLFEKSNDIGHKRGAWRCIYLGMADKAERHNRTLRVHFIVAALTDLLAGLDGYIYLCADGDVVILFEGALKPVAERLGGHFEDFNIALLGGASPFSIFDLSLNDDWQEFSRKCRDKYAVLINGFRPFTGVAEGVR